MNDPYLPGKPCPAGGELHFSNALNFDGQARRVLDEAQAGVFVEPENQDAEIRG